MRKVLIIDTSILCVWLAVPGKETCGSTDNKWIKEQVDQLIAEEIQAGATLVLPLATLIETGNHIAQASSKRYETAQALAAKMCEAADSQPPWVAFDNQSRFWNAEGLKKLAEELPGLASQKISIGDATIKAVAEYYAQVGFVVEILTGDQGLKAYEPVISPLIPRRRRPLP